MISTKPKGNHAGYIATSTIVQNFSRAVHQPTSSQPQQPRQHRHHHHAKAMETDQTRDEKRARRHLPHSSSLDTRGKAQMRATVSGWLKYKEFVIVYNTKYDVSSAVNVAESLRAMRGFRYDTIVHSLGKYHEIYMNVRPLKTGSWVLDRWRSFSKRLSYLAC